MPLLGSFGVSSFGLGKLVAGGEVDSDYELIQSIALSSAGDITFDLTGLNSTYHTLELRGSFRTTLADKDDAIGVRFNNDSTTSAYTRSTLDYSGGSVRAISHALEYGRIGDASAANASGAVFFPISSIINFPFNTNQYTSWIAMSGVYDNGTGYYRVSQDSGYWNNKTTVTAIKLFSASGADLAIGTKAELYGLKVV